MTTEPPTPPAGSSLECGARFGPTAAGALTVTGRFPAVAAAAEQVVNGAVEVVASRSAARGVVTPMAEAFLVRNGRIVTLPVPQDAVGRDLALSEGSVERLPAVAALVPCAGGDTLSSGTYDLYVRVVLNRDDGTRTEAVGGPWPLEVR